MNEWYRKFYSDLDIQITEEELKVVDELYRMFLKKMEKVNKLNLSRVEPMFLESCDKT